MIRRRRPDQFADLEPAPLDADAWIATFLRGGQRTGLALTSEFAKRGLLFRGRAVTGAPAIPPSVRVARGGAHAKPRPVGVATRVRRRLPGGGSSRPALPAGTSEGDQS